MKYNQEQNTKYYNRNKEKLSVLNGAVIVS